MMVDNGKQEMGQEMKIIGVIANILLVHTSETWQTKVIGIFYE